MAQLHGNDWIQITLNTARQSLNYWCHLYITKYWSIIWWTEQKPGILHLTAICNFDSFGTFGWWLYEISLCILLRVHKWRVPTWKSDAAWVEKIVGIYSDCTWLYFLHNCNSCVKFLFWGNNQSWPKGFWCPRWVVSQMPPCKPGGHRAAVSKARHSLLHLPGTTKNWLLLVLRAQDNELVFINRVEWIKGHKIFFF